MAAAVVAAFGWSGPLTATHNRAGEITFRQLGQTTYEVTLITYTDSRSTQADRPEVEILWGDNTRSTVPRKQRLYLGNFIQFNRYVDTHTYPGPGRYVIQFFDPNRVAGINNISNSVNVPFYVETELVIDPFQGVNNSPVLLQPPIDFAEVGVPFVHYPNGYDPDGDSIAYALTVPKQDPNAPVPGYYDPPASNYFRLDARTGRLEWNAPVAPGIYNIAIRVDEFRNGRRIGYIVRDMQIIVQNQRNRPPQVDPPADTCVLGGDTLELAVRASDPDVAQTVRLFATGGPFVQPTSPARLVPSSPVGHGQVTALFRWRVACESIRKRPYRVVFRAVDNHPSVPLADLQHLDITVNGPPPRLETITPDGLKLHLRWRPPQPCSGPELKGYYVYRREDSSGWTPGVCDRGAPGFQRVAFIRTPDDTAWTDSLGIYPGRRYCYRITAIYQAGTHYEPTEGQASNEQCFTFSAAYPLLTHASVRRTDAVDGQVDVRAFLPPLDTTQWRPPYSVAVYRKGAGVIAYQTFASYAQYRAADTAWVDSGLNTVSGPAAYELILEGRLAGETVQFSSGVAETPFLQLDGGNRSLHLRWRARTPWVNDSAAIWRQDPDSVSFRRIAVTSNGQWTDTGLTVGRRYCYFIETFGRYPAADPPGEPFLNRSQVVCAVPEDTVPPCPPQLGLVAFCEMEAHERIAAPFHRLWWTPHPDTCADETRTYRLYFSRSDSDGFQPIAELSAATTEYVDRRDSLVYSAAGCYYLTAVDEFGNESPPSNRVCADNCPNYRLPNIFTPNADGFNDRFAPIPPVHFVRRADIRIYDRWGREVFRAATPFFEWDGTDADGHPLPEGVYYYECDYQVDFLNLPEPRTFRIRGSIQLIR